MTLPKGYRAGPRAQVRVAISLIIFFSPCRPPAPTPVSSARQDATPDVCTKDSERTGRVGSFRGSARFDRIRNCSLSICGETMTHRHRDRDTLSTLLADELRR